MPLQLLPAAKPYCPAVRSRLTQLRHGRSVHRQGPPKRCFNDNDSGLQARCGGTAQQIGSTIYYNLTIGGRPVRYTKQVIGQQTYGSDGSSSRRIEGQPYTRTPQGITYTQQRIGNFI
jgi:hypothetical protein